MASDNKIFLLDRKDLTVRKICKNVPKYADYINSDDRENLLLMNHSGDFIYRYEYNTEQSAKKKIKRCAGIIRSTDNEFVIFSTYEGIYNYNLESNTIKKSLEIEPYYKCLLNKAGTLYLIDKNVIYVFSLNDKKIIDKYIFDAKFLIANIFLKQKIIFTYEWEKANVLVCWKYE